MPIYEYVCEACGSEFDAMRSFKDSDTPIACKQCESPRTHRKLSVFYACSDGRSVSGASGGGGCGGCSGGNCGSCGH